MIGITWKKPRFRATAAETRHWILLHFLSLEVLLASEPDNVEYKAVRELFYHLYEYYKCLGVAPYDKDHAAKSVRSFLWIYKQLSGFDPAEKLWALKPKLHLMQELVENGEQLDESYSEMAFDKIGVDFEKI